MKFFDEIDHPLAMYNLGLMHAYGIGIVPSCVHAVGVSVLYLSIRSYFRL
jgi:TPR repeat protein